MSRIGKQPISILNNIEVQILGQEILIKGLKGEKKLEFPKVIGVSLKGSNLSVSLISKNRKDKALWGLWRTLLSNAVLGISQGFRKELEIIGSGYKVEIRGQNLILQLGFSHPVEYKIPVDVSIKVSKNIISVEGIDKQRVGQVTAEIRSLKKPEPYKGKGIRYLGEEVKLKPGKAGKAAGAK